VSSFGEAADAGSLGAACWPEHEEYKAKIEAKTIAAVLNTRRV